MFSHSKRSFRGYIFEAQVLVCTHIYGHFRAYAMTYTQSTRPAFNDDLAPLIGGRLTYHLLASGEGVLQHCAKMRRISSADRETWDCYRGLHNPVSTGHDSGSSLIYPTPKLSHSSHRLKSFQCAYFSRCGPIQPGWTRPFKDARLLNVESYSRLSHHF